MDIELKKIITDLGETFNEFKKTNDQRFEELKTKGVADPLTAERLEKISARLGTIDEMRSRMDDLEAKGSRKPGMNGSDREELLAEHKEAFQNGFFRKGNELGLRDLEMRALNVGTPGDGGHAVPEDLDRNIHDLLVDVSDFRRIANVVQVGTSDYKKLVNTRGTQSGWVGEVDARPQTGSPNFVEIAPPVGEIYANLYATQHMLDDAFFNVEEFISSNLATEFGRAEGVAFIQGDGVNKPQGFLTGPTAATADGVRAFGALQFLATGVAGGFAAAPDGGDILIDTTMALKKGHRAGALWAMTKATLGEARKLKNTDGSYMWRPGLEEGASSRLLGYGVEEMEDMPEIAVDSFGMAFGNFKTGYTIVDRMGTRMLRDPYTNKPYVTFYVTKRVGGKLIDSEAIKLVKFSL